MSSQTLSTYVEFLYKNYIINAYRVWFTVYIMSTAWDELTNKELLEQIWTTNKSQRYRSKNFRIFCRYPLNFDNFHMQVVVWSKIVIKKIPKPKYQKNSKNSFLYSLKLSQKNYCMSNVNLIHWYILCMFSNLFETYFFFYQNIN